MKISLCLLATKKYKQFVQPLLEDVKKYFLPNHQIEVNLFIDKLGEYEGDERVSVCQTQIPDYSFPLITLYRYEIMSYIKYDSDYIFYLDVDMSIVDFVDDEILAPIVAVYHPGFYNGGGSWGNNPKSLSYTPPENRKHYFAGGFQGGSKDHYVAIMNLLKERINEDELNEVMAEWQDETHWNQYLSQTAGFKTLTPDYCMVEQQELREKWGISHFAPKIIALAKDHKTIRA